LVSASGIGDAVCPHSPSLFPPLARRKLPALFKTFFFRTPPAPPPELVTSHTHPSTLPRWLRCSRFKYPLPFPQSPFPDCSPVQSVSLVIRRFSVSCSDPVSLGSPQIFMCFAQPFSQRLFTPIQNPPHQPPPTRG